MQARPDDIIVTRCQACPQQIFFAVTAGGKPAPFDWEGEAGPWELTGEYVTTHGRRLPVIRYAGRESATGYETHFKTCPEATRFRKPRERQLSLIQGDDSE